MGSFNWTISPGVTRAAKDQSLTDPLFISVDGVPEAKDVLLRMIETDIWSLPDGRVIREGKGSFEVVASLRMSELHQRSRGQPDGGPETHLCRAPGRHDRRL
jgi:hypothetical protein